MQKKLLFSLVITLMLAFMCSGCAEFLEDYQYSPIGEVSSAGY